MPYTEQTVTAIRQWSDKTFSLRTTRPENFQFANGEFVSIGLRHEGKLIARAYSIVSTNDQDFLEFLSIKVPNGPLTGRLAAIRTGDGVWVNSKSTGTLTLKHILPGRNLFLLSTGTGLAPFLSLIRDETLYQHFEHVVLVHSVRTVAELAYKEELEALCNERFYYVPTVTREAFTTTQRGADLFRSGELFQKTGLPQADPAQDRVMLCGNPDMNLEMTAYLEAQGWNETRHGVPGNFTTEKAFAIRNE